MVDVEPKPVVIVTDDRPVRCRSCEHVFKSFRLREIGTGKTVTVLSDLDGVMIYDLVMVCPRCKDVYHWHSKDSAIRDNTYAFERLMRHYEERRAIINGEKEDG